MYVCILKSLFTHNLSCLVPWLRKLTLLELVAFINCEWYFSGKLQYAASVHCLTDYFAVGSLALSLLYLTLSSEPFYILQLWRVTQKCISHMLLISCFFILSTWTPENIWKYYFRGKNYFTKTLLHTVPLTNLCIYNYLHHKKKERNGLQNNMNIIRYIIGIYCFYAHDGFAHRI